jgi:hypothetical protein
MGLPDAPDSKFLPESPDFGEPVPIKATSQKEFEL